jgi:phage shock protein PspC (stress-responsive transcriptional regulator)
MIQFLGFVRDFFAILGFLSFIAVIVVAIAMPREPDSTVKRGRRPF